MYEIGIKEIPQMFKSVAVLFAKKKSELCEMDALMGDGDLGLTMSKGFDALQRYLFADSDANDVGMMLFKAGMKMQNAVPSTMGTLMSSGVMEAGKALKGKTKLIPKDFETYVCAFAVGIQKRGKCKLGDRTILDSIDAAAKEVTELIKEKPDANFLEVFNTAVVGAEEGVEATRNMVPKFGKAVTHMAKAKGIPDQGAIAGLYMLTGLRNYFAEQTDISLN